MPETLTSELFLVGHQVETVESRWEGARLVYQIQKPVSNIYAYEFRAARVMEGRAHKLIHSGTFETKLDEKPAIPPTAFRVAQAIAGILLN